MPPPDPWDGPASRHPPDKPLPKLDQWTKWVQGGIASAAAMGLYRWDQAKLDAIKALFKPVPYPGGKGCMMACYDVLRILYGKKGDELQKEVYRQARAMATQYAKDHPDVFARYVERVKADVAAGSLKLEGMTIEWHAIDYMTSPYNTSDHLFELMRRQDLAGDRVKSPTADVEQAISGMAGGGPGVYFFGLAVNDNHTVTLAVDRAADGSHKMYWLDQNNPGLNAEVPSGQLGATLQRVQGYAPTTNIYAYRAR